MPHDAPAMTDHHELREQIWDYVYGLLSDDEGRALVARVKSDPQAARLYAEVKLQADLVGDAARVEDSSLVLNRAAIAKQQAAAVAARSQSARQSPVLRRTLSWLVGAGATALALLLTVGFVRSRASLPMLASNFVVTEVIATSPLTAGISNQLTLKTYQVRGAGQAAMPAAAATALRLIGSDGQERFQTRVQTSDAGEALVELPGDAIQPGVKLQLTAVESGHAARNTNKSAEVSAELPVQEEPIMAYFLVGEPTIEAGKQVPFSAWNFTAFSARPAETDTANAVLESAGGTAIAEAPVTVAPQQGLVNGYLQAPANLEAESLKLQMNETVSNSLAKEAAAAAPSRPPQQQSYAFSPYQRLPSARGTMRQQAMKQQIALNEPQEPAATTTAQAAGAKKADASYVNQARRGRAQQLSANLAQDVPAGQPVELSVPEELSSKELQIAAVCRGVTVATATVGEKQSPVAGQRQLADKAAAHVKLDLPPEADGLIEIEWFDRSTGDSGPVFRNTLYREPQRGLQIDLAAARQQYAPGERVHLKMQVRDEKGRPAADSRLGVRVWNEQAVQLSGEEPTLLADAVRNASNEPSEQAAQQQMLPQLAQKPMSERAKDAAQADRPQAAAAATTAAPQAAEPIPLVSNRDRVEAAAREAVSAAAVHRREVSQMIAWMLIGGGLVVLCLAATEVVLRAAAHAKLMVPAGALAAVCLVVGLLWIASPRPATERQLAMADSAEATRAANPSASEPRHGDTLAENDKSPAGRVAGIAGGGEAATEPLNRAAEPMADQSAGVVRENAPADRQLAQGQSADEAKSATRYEAKEESSPALRKLATAPPAPRDSRLDRLSTAPARARRPGISLPAASSDSLTPSAPAVASGPAPGGSPANPSAGVAGGAFGGGMPASGSPRSAALSRNAQPANNPAVTSLAASGEAAAPAALYFNPQLLTDAQGQATIEFTMPQVPAEYRLLIDALGQGRIGSQQMTLTCGAPAK